MWRLVQLAYVMHSCPTSACYPSPEMHGHMYVGCVGHICACIISLAQPLAEWPCMQGPAAAAGIHRLVLARISCRQVAGLIGREK